MMTPVLLGAGLPSPGGQAAQAPSDLVGQGVQQGSRVMAVSADDDQFQVGRPEGTSQRVGRPYGDVSCLARFDTADLPRIAIRACAVDANTMLLQEDAPATCPGSRPRGGCQGLSLLSAYP